MFLDVTSGLSAVSTDMSHVSRVSLQCCVVLCCVVSVRCSLRSVRGHCVQLVDLLLVLGHHDGPPEFHGGSCTDREAKLVKLRDGSLPSICSSN